MHYKGLIHILKVEISQICSTKEVRIDPLNSPYCNFNNKKYDFIEITQNFCQVEKEHSELKKYDTKKSIKHIIHSISFRQKLNHWVVVVVMDVMLFIQKSTTTSQTRQQNSTALQHNETARVIAQQYGSH